MFFFQKIFLKHFLLYIQRGKKVYQERTKPISVTIAINSLLLKQGRNDIWKIVQENQAVYIILIINVSLVTKITCLLNGTSLFVVYFDFETTAPTDNCLDPEQKKLFVVSYVMIVAFHPELKLDQIIIDRSFAHSLEQLATLDYFSRE